MFDFYFYLLFLMLEDIWDSKYLPDKGMLAQETGRPVRCLYRVYTMCGWSTIPADIHYQLSACNPIACL